MQAWVGGPVIFAELKNNSNFTWLDCIKRGINHLENNDREKDCRDLANASKRSLFGRWGSTIAGPSGAIILTGKGIPDLLDYCGQNVSSSGPTGVVGRSLPSMSPGFWFTGIYGVKQG